MRGCGCTKKKFVTGILAIQSLWIQYVKLHTGFSYFHYANACPTKEASDIAPVEPEAKAFQTWEDSVSYATYRVEMAMNPQDGDEVDASVIHIRLERNQVLLDNQADVSVFHPSLLTHLEPVDREVKIAGVGGRQLIVKQTGYLDGISGYMPVRESWLMY